MTLSVTSTPAYRGKRFLDVIAGSILLFCLSPLCLLVAAMIKLTDSGPVLFWQQRVGSGGVLFNFPKFRSMVTDAEALQAFLERDNKHGAEGVTFKIEKDPRITRLGRFIRRHSIDEIPQLWCVVKGDMSLVGPRPATPREVAKYDSWQRGRLQAKPGLTGLWQVSGRSDLTFREQVELDLQYIRSQGLLLDLKIILLTIPAVLTGHGAY
jgi:lipopolysaccharide/colanic/teichoic acid biosynthesis glycosyltransferase